MLLLYSRIPSPFMRLYLGLSNKSDGTSRLDHPLSVLMTSVVHGPTMMACVWTSSIWCSGGRKNGNFISKACDLSTTPARAKGPKPTGCVVSARALPWWASGTPGFAEESKKQLSDVGFP